MNSLMVYNLLVTTSNENTLVIIFYITFYLITVLAIISTVVVIQKKKRNKNNKNIFKNMKENVGILKLKNHTNKIGIVPEQQNYANPFHTFSLKSKTQSRCTYVWLLYRSG